MLLRTVFLLVLLALPLPVNAAAYVVHRGDTLGGIAARYGVSQSSLAQANGIANLDMVRAGRTLIIPSVTLRRVSSPRSFGTGYYRVRWGDTLLGLAIRFHTYTSSLRALNPSLGQYLVTGSLLRVPSSSGLTVSASATSAASSTYTVQPGDTLSGIAARYGLMPSRLLTLNNLSDPDRLLAGTRLAIPGGTSATVPTVYNAWGVRTLIVQQAQLYGVEPSLALAVSWQESGFNQALVSSTGAIGVMQVEPATGAHVSALLGRRFNLYSTGDNIQVGVFWLSQLIAYYGGNERLATAAYYQGARALAQHGWYTDTVQYVANVFALKSRFGS